MDSDLHNFSAAEMTEATRNGRLGVRFAPQQLSCGGPIARGWYVERALTPLMVTAGRMRLTRSLTHGMSASPMLYFGLSLEGAISARWAREKRSWNAGEFLAGSLREPTDMESLHQAGETVAMAGVVIDRGWLEGVAEVEFGAELKRSHDFWQAHLALHSGPAPYALRAAAERILQTARDAGLIPALHLEAATFDFVATMFEILAATGPADVTRLAPRMRRKMAAVRDRLETAGPEENLSLAALACEFGIGLRTLSRNFRIAYGTTIPRYLGRRRLERARVALADGTATIAQAAYLAGYASPANFATAFRRAFGFAPGACRGK